MKEFLEVFERKEMNVRTFWREGGCPLTVKNYFWPYSPWEAFRLLTKHQ